MPVTGNVLDPDGLNADLHSATGGVSLYGEACGSIQDANFAAGMRIRAEHVRPQETFRWRSDGMTDTLDYWEDLFHVEAAADADDPIAGSTTFIPIAGCGTRLYLPFDCTCVLYNASIFYTVFRMRERGADDVADVRTGPPIMLKLYIDQVAVGYTLRKTPITYHGPNGPSIATPPVEKESMQTLHYDCCHLAIAAGGDPSRTTRGYHDVDMRLFIGRNRGVENFRPPFAGAGSSIQYPLSNRFRCGVRKGLILGFL